MTEYELTQRIVSVLDNMFKERCNDLVLHEPKFSGNEWGYVKECLDTGWVSSVGKYVDQFERQLAEYVGAPYAVAVVNGTAALHISLLLAGVHPRDEVIVPSLTFIATANAISYCGAYCHFVDIDRSGFGLDAGKLSDYLHDITKKDEQGNTINRITGRKIAAVVPVHIFGHSVDLDTLLAVCEDFRLALVEDAAESLGSHYKGRHTGTLGLFGTFSFNGNKIVTTGGGGAIVTSDTEMARAAKHLTTTAKLPHRWNFVHDRIGYNYRMPNLNAALGCAQLEQLDEMLSSKRRLAKAYIEAFKSVEGASIVHEPAYGHSNYWLNAIVLEQPNMKLRDEIMEALHAAGFMVRPCWTPMHRLLMYEDHPRMPLPVTEDVEASVINLPSSPSLEERLSFPDGR